MTVTQAHLFDLRSLDIYDNFTISEEALEKFPFENFATFDLTKRQSLHKVMLFVIRINNVCETRKRHKLLHYNICLRRNVNL